MFAIGLVILALVVLVVVGISTCASGTQESTTSASYDWSELSSDGDRLSLASDGVIVSQVGVDVSDHQGDIDWEAVAADGIDFAYVRLGNRGYTEGGLSVDETAADNLDEAAAAGLEVGAYFFSQATTVDEAVEEAELALEVLDGRALDLPVAFDHETIGTDDARADDISGEELAAIAEAFCEVLEAAGYDTIIYGNSYDLARFDEADLEGQLIWLAEYTLAEPSTEVGFVLWQYTNAGTVAGIEGSVDLNLRLTEAL